MIKTSRVLWKVRSDCKLVFFSKDFQTKSKRQKQLFTVHNNINDKRIVDRLWTNLLPCLCRNLKKGLYYVRCRAVFVCTIFYFFFTLVCSLFPLSRMYDKRQSDWEWITVWLINNEIWHSNEIVALKLWGSFGNYCTKALIWHLCSIGTVVN